MPAANSAWKRSSPPTPVNRIPGKSNAFAISKKLGLPDFIIEDAKSHLEAKDESFEDLLASLETSRVTIEKEQEEIRSYKEEIAQLKYPPDPEGRTSGRAQG